MGARLLVWQLPRFSEALAHGLLFLELVDFGLEPCSDFADLVQGGGVFDPQLQKLYFAAVHLGKLLKRLDRFRPHSSGVVRSVSSCIPVVLAGLHVPLDGLLQIYLFFALFGPLGRSRCCIYVASRLDFNVCHLLI